MKLSPETKKKRKTNERLHRLGNKRKEGRNKKGTRENTDRRKRQNATTKKGNKNKPTENRDRTERHRIIRIRK